jgi:hypothetical protein
MSSIKFIEPIEIETPKKSNNIIIEEVVEVKNNDITNCDYNDKINYCIKELNIDLENKIAIDNLKKYLYNPEMIMELLDLEDIYNLFIDKFKKKYL